MGKRCDACLQTGYQGRQPVVEFLRLNGDARTRVAARDVESLVARPSLSDHARVLVQEGVTDESECRRVLG
jgi:type II secretory ATPase GspE/PulE/Tfp pilus assembly ATPase PilB-like protein